MLTTLLSQAAGVNDPVAPWLSLVVQLGALGVLIMLAWHTPRILSALRTWRDDAERMHREERKQLREDGKEALQAVLKHCDETARARDANMGAIQKEVEYLQEAIESLGRPRRKQPPPAQPPGGPTT